MDFVAAMPLLSQSFIGNVPFLTPFDTWNCVAYEGVSCKKKNCDVVSQSSKHGKITLPHEFMGRKKI